MPECATFPIQVQLRVIQTLYYITRTEKTLKLARGQRPGERPVLLLLQLRLIKQTNRDYIEGYIR